MVKVAEISRHMDLGEIQLYIINGAKVVFLRRRPQPKAPRGTSSNYTCLMCSRHLQVGYWEHLFCFSEPFPFRPGAFSNPPCAGPCHAYPKGALATPRTPTLLVPQDNNMFCSLQCKLDTQAPNLEHPSTPLRWNTVPAKATSGQSQMGPGTPPGYADAPMLPSFERCPG